MALAAGKQKPSKGKRARQEARRAEPAALTAASVAVSQEDRDSSELPSRAALVERLEAQRAELLRAMSSVNHARRTIEQHVAKPPFAGALTVTGEQHEFYRQRVLEDLSDAGDALRAAYPVLERIVQALAVDEILKAHTATAASAFKRASTVSDREPE